MKWTQLVQSLSLTAHPEGGYYREVFRHVPSSPQGTAPCLATHILYLLPRGDRSMLHRLQEAELWHYYSGAPLALHYLDADTHQVVRLGPPPHTPFFAIDPDVWFAAESTGDWTLVGCTVVPGFRFDHFELAQGEQLLADYPHLESFIRDFTPPFP